MLMAQTICGIDNRVVCDLRYTVAFCICFYQQFSVDSYNQITAVRWVWFTSTGTVARELMKSPCTNYKDVIWALMHLISQAIYCLFKSLSRLVTKYFQHFKVTVRCNCWYWFFPKLTISHNLLMACFRLGQLIHEKIISYIILKRIALTLWRS